MRELESAIIAEVRDVTGRRSLRVKDMREWNTSEQTVRDGKRDDEDLVHCRRLDIWVCVPKAKTRPRAGERS